MIEEFDISESLKQKKLAKKLEETKDGMMDYCRLNNVDAAVAYTTFLGLASFIAIESRVGHEGFIASVQEMYIATWEAKYGTNKKG